MSLAELNAYVFEKYAFAKAHSKLVCCYHGLSFILLKVRAQIAGNSLGASLYCAYRATIQNLFKSAQNLRI